MRDKLRRDIDAHVAAVRTSKLAELSTTYEVVITCDLTIGLNNDLALSCFEIVSSRALLLLLYEHLELLVLLTFGIYV